MTTLVGAATAAWTKIETFMYAIDRRVFQAALSPWIQIFTNERLAITLNVTSNCIRSNFRKCTCIIRTTRITAPRVGNVAGKCSGGCWLFIYNTLLSIPIVFCRRLELLAINFISLKCARNKFRDILRNCRDKNHFFCQPHTKRELFSTSTQCSRERRNTSI